MAKIDYQMSAKHSLFGRYIGTKQFTPPPFSLDDENLSETVRLTHRVLDLRRPPMQKALCLRYRAAMAARQYLDSHGFIDIETPVLVVHSENDLRCNVEQGEHLFTLLRLLGKEVEMLRFPAEGHELSRSGSPVHRVQRFEAILDWFGRYLSPGES